MRYILALLLLLPVGCIEVKNESESEVSSFVLTDSLKEVQKEFKKITSKEDKEYIYKQFAGSAAYIKNAEKLETTAGFEVLIGKVQSSYGWDRDKYPKFTDAVSAYVTEQGFDKPRTLTSQADKDWLYEIFNSLAEAIKNE
jgi:hypothetical protein